MMSLGMILWTVAIVLVVWLVVRGLTAVERRGSTGLKSEAEDLLRRRFASGEIDAEEYERRLAVLRG
jgi:putative membrane protein